MAMLTLLLVPLFTGCAAQYNATQHNEAQDSAAQNSAAQNSTAEYDVSNESSNETVQNTAGTDELQQNKTEGQIGNLQALTTWDRSEGGKIFEAVSEDFIASFPDKTASLTIPDARKGERAVSVLEGSEIIGKSNLLFLGSIPDQNIYLYGYNDVNYPGCGLILDVGRKQNIAVFPYRYMTNTLLQPELSVSNDGRTIYISCHTGSGTGVSVSELYAFRVSDNQIRPYYVDINDLANRLADKITVTYDAESKKVIINSNGRNIMTDSLFAIGAADGENTVPDGFYCGDQIHYSLGGDSAKVLWMPVFFTQKGAGVQSYLESQVFLEADLSFIYDSNGNITGFDLGEVMPEGDDPIYQHTEMLSADDRQLECNILVHKNLEVEDGYLADITLIDTASGETIQQLQYNKYRDDFMPDTIQDGSQIIDVNQDGNDDVMLDLGVYGWAQLYACFVYDPFSRELLQVSEFEEHPFPEVLSDEGIVLFHGKDGATTYWVDRYRVEGNQLTLLGRLTQIMGQSVLRYTEEVMSDGILIKIKENVTEKEIDNFNSWHMWT